jgi:hypothetical protein
MCYTAVWYEDKVGINVEEDLYCNVWAVFVFTPVFNFNMVLLRPYVFSCT